MDDNLLKKEETENRKDSSDSLLLEYLPFSFTQEQINESKKENNGKIILRGIVQKANTLNQNGRIYPKPILERELRNYQKFINENRALGQLDHPSESVVELKHVSHVVKKAWMEGDNVYAVIELLNTPDGKIAQSLVESGVTLGISSRGVGSTKKVDGNEVVQDDFQLICWDLVSEPSTPGAFMMKENKKISKKELNSVFNRTDRIDRIMNQILEWE